MEKALQAICARCREHRLTAIVGVEWQSHLGLENRAVVISPQGEILGYQTKNQITPGGEAENYVPDGQRQMFESNGIRFGIVVCHEGWRYPETVRWAAVRGAKIVFQPQYTGWDTKPPAPPAKWGECFYEKAMQCRAEENSVYFVSVNHTLSHQNSASSVIAPDGKLLAHVPRGEEKLLVTWYEEAIERRSMSAGKR
jgi:predicted amidohydrolase